MREDQDAPPLIHQFGQHGHQQVQLGPLLDPLRGQCLDEAGIAADLAEFEQRIEDDDLAASKPLLAISSRTIASMADRTAS